MDSNTDATTKLANKLLCKQFALNPGEHIPFLLKVHDVGVENPYRLKSTRVMVNA